MTTDHARSPGLSSNRLRRGLLLAAAVMVGLWALPGEAQLAAVDAPVAAPPHLALQADANHLEVHAAVHVDAAAQDLDADRASDARAPERRRGLDEVYWTVPEPTSAEALAAAWGVGKDRLLELNPDLEPGARVPAGAALRVFQADPAEPTRSIGAPNRGKLQNGVPLPEGDAWRLRTMRRRAYGTPLTVATLVDAFTAYGERYPDGPKIRVGELAQRKGGKVAPHASHRSGRDVDLGYVCLGDDDGETRWRQMNEDNFDAEKNWFLMHEMIKSGNVEAIFVSKRLQKLLYAEAQKHLPEDELAELFQYPRAGTRHDPLIRHWRGHRDHMHVRFRCADDDPRCRSTAH